MWTFARGSENILITSETTGWKLQPVVSLRVITTIDQRSQNSHTTLCNHRSSRHGQTTDPVQLKLCLFHKRRLASNADVGFYCVNIMTTSFSSPERIVWTIMSGIITVTRLMSSLGIKDHWVNEFIFDSFIHFTQKGHGEITCIFISLQKTWVFKSWPWYLF